MQRMFVSRLYFCFSFDFFFHGTEGKTHAVDAGRRDGREGMK